MIKLDYFSKMFTKSFDFQCFYSVCFYFEKNSSNLSRICQLFVEKAKIEGSRNITYLVAQFCKASSGKEWWETCNKSQKSAQNGIFGNYSAISCQTKTVKCSGIKDFKKLPILSWKLKKQRKVNPNRYQDCRRRQKKFKGERQFLMFRKLVFESCHCFFVW